MNRKLSPLSRGCISSILNKKLTILLHAVIDEGPKALLKGKSKTGRANVWNCHHRHRIYDYHNNGSIIHEARENKIQGGIAVQHSLYLSRHSGKRSPTQVCLFRIKLQSVQ